MKKLFMIYHKDTNSSPIRKDFCDKDHFVPIDEYFVPLLFRSVDEAKAAITYSISLIDASSEGQFLEYKNFILTLAIVEVNLELKLENMVYELLFDMVKLLK